MPDLHPQGQDAAVPQSRTATTPHHAHLPYRHTYSSGMHTFCQTGAGVTWVIGAQRKLDTSYIQDAHQVPLTRNGLSSLFVFSSLFFFFRIPDNEGKAKRGHILS